MPIYEYKRPDGSTFEVVQSFSDEPLTNDPDTGVPVQRVLHAPAVHFKGSGFYNTDYGTRKRQRENAASSSEESKAGKDDGSKGADGESKAKTDQASGKGGSTDTAGSSNKGAPAAKPAKPASAKG
ncbi:MAG TPA: FmdB family zinc ribbon protein [Solirubrobacteraceae bacterium]|nr:FmdB family zinc ribbon protein [Solirubrobacteraceae bacterium]